MTEAPKNTDGNAFLIKALARGWLSGHRNDAGQPRFQTLTRDTRARSVTKVNAAQAPSPIVFEPVASPETTNVTPGEAEAGSVPENSDVLNDTPEDGGRKPRFRIRKFADLRGPKAKWLSLRPFVKKRETPHCPYEMPVFKNPSRLQLEERNAARIEAIRVTKPERNVRLAYAIEEVWGDVATIRSDYLRRGSTASIGDIRYHDKGRYEGVQLLTDVEAKREPFESGTKFFPTQLIMAQEKILEVATRNWFNAKDKLLFGVPADEVTDEGRDFQRLSELVGLMNTSRYEDLYSPTNTYSLIDQGFNNAVLLQWGLFAVSHEVFKDEYKREATKKELASMYASSEHIAASMAIGHLQITFPFRNHIAGNINSVAMDFNKADFMVRKVVDPESGEILPILDIKPETFKAFEEKFEERLQHPDPEKPLNRLDEDATGCPALYSEGMGPITQEESEAQQKVQHVIAELADWSYLIATELSEDFLNAPDTVEESIARGRISTGVTAS